MVPRIAAASARALGCTRSRVRASSENLWSPAGTGGNVLEHAGVDQLLLAALMLPGLTVVL